MGPSRKWLMLAALVWLAPDTPGVIELWDGDELVYVGATRRDGETLRSELVRQLSGVGGDATHFSWEICFDPLPRERELLAEFERIYHRPPRFNL